MPIIVSKNVAPTGSASATLVAGSEDTAYTVTTASLLQGFTDANGDTLSVVGLTADHGTVALVNGNYVITPTANYNGTVSLSYTVSDGKGGTIAASQHFTLAAVNDAPTGSATASLAAGTEDTSYTVTSAQLLQGFSDVDTADAVNPDHLSVINLTADHGTVVANQNGSFTITPAANYNGAVHLSYTVTDTHGATVAGSQSFTLAAVNDAPVGTATAVLAAGTEDTAYTVTSAQLLQGFSDVDTADATNPDHLSVINLTADHGTVVANQDGSFTITPAANYNGAVHLSYTVTDTHGATVAGSQSFTLAAVNDAPVGTATAVLAAGTEDTAYTVTSAQLLQGFSDVDTADATNPDHLSVINLTADHGTVVANQDGSFTITPAANYNGAVHLSYTVTDTHGATVAGSQSFTLAAVNDAPVGSATAELAAGTEDTAYTVTSAQLLQGFSDVDTADATNPDHLSVINLTADHGTVVANQDGSFTITPDANYNGAVNLSYTVTDTHGATVAGSQSFTLAAVNDAPVGTATAELVTGTEDTAYTVTSADLLQGFSDVDTADATNPDHLSVINLTADHGTVVANQDGSFTITPDANYNGAVSLSYTVTDTHGAVVAGSQSFTLAAVNDAPTVSAPVQLPDALENQASIVITAAQLLANASDVDSPVLSISSVSVDPAFGTISQNGNGDFVFVPAAHTSGDVTFAVVVSDGELTVNTTAALHLTAQPQLATEQSAISAVEASVQTATISLDSSTTFDVGDVYQVQIGTGEPVSVSIDDNQQTIATVLTALTDQLNLQYGSSFTAVLSQDGLSIVLTATAAADSQTITAVGLNVQAGVNDQAANANTTAGAAAIAAHAQIDVVSFDSVYDIADHVEVTVNGNVYGVDIDDTAAYNSNSSLVATVLAQKINADAAVNGVVHATVDDAGQLVLTATTAGTGFTLDASSTNASTGTQGLTISSLNAHENVTFVPAVAQVETFNLGADAYQPGDVVTVTLNGTPYSYTVHAGDSQSAISSALAALLPNTVVATVDQAGELVLTAAQAGSSFTASAAVNNISFTANTVASDSVTAATANASQVSTVQLDDHYDVGDTVTMTVNGQNYSYTVADEAHTSGSAVAQALLAVAGNALQTHTENSGTQILIEYWNNAGPNPGFPFPGNWLPVFVTVPDTNPDTISAAIAANTPPGYVWDGFWEPLGPGNNQQTITPSVTAAANGSTITLTDHDTAGSFTAGLSVTDHVYADNTAVVGTVATAAAPGSAGVAQVSSVGFTDAAVTAGEVYSVTVNGTTYSTTAVAGSTLLGVVNALRSQIANDSGAAVTVISSKSTLYLTAKVAGEAVEITSGDANTHTVAINTLKPAVPAVAAVQQVDSITLSQTYDVGDVVHLVVGGATLASHTVTAADTDASIAAALVDLVDSGSYTASSNNGVITITATQANVAFSASATVDNASGTTNAPNAATAVTTTVEAHTATAQLDTLTFNPSYDAGDVVSVTVNGNTVNFTVLAGHTAAADVAAGLAALLNGNADVSATVNQAGNLVLTATHTNTAVTVSSAVTNVGITDNQVADTHSVPNTTPLTAAAQVDKVTITDTHVDAGDTYTLNLSIGGGDPLQVVYEAQDGDTAASVALALRALATIQLNGQNVAVGGSGADIVLTSTVAGTALDTSLDIANAPAGSDTAHALSAHSTDAVTAHVQSTTVTFAEAVAGDVLTVSLSGGDVVETVTVDAGETLAQAAARLAALVNLDGVGATADANGVITITGATNAASFTVDAATGVTAATVSSTNLSAATVNQTTAPVAATKQVDTITLNAGALDEGDQVTVTVNGANYSVTVSHAHAGNMTAVLGDLVAAINNADTGSTLVTAAVQNGTLVLTENNAGAGAYAVTSHVTDVSGTLVTVTGAAATQAQAGIAVAAQQNTITLAGGNFDSTDTLTVHIGNQTFTETGLGGLTAAQVATQLVNDINTNALSEMTATQVNGVVTLTQKAADISNGAVTVTASINQETAHNNAATYAVTTSAAAATTAKAQIDNITFGNAAPVAGDVYSVTVGSATYSVTATASSTLVSILTSLKSAMASDPSVTVIRSGNSLVLTAKTAGAAGFTAIGEHDSGQVVTAATVTVYAGHDATTATQEVTAIHLGAADYDTGDVVVATIAGHTFTVNVTQPTAAADVATLLQAAVGNTYVGSFTVQASGTDLVVTATATNTALNVSAAVQNNTLHANTAAVSVPLVTNVAHATAQVLDVAYTGTAKAGDVVTVHVGGHDYSYTVASGDAEAQVYAGLVAAIGTAGGAIGGASYDAVNHQLVLTGLNDGSSFTATLSTTVATVFAGTATEAATTANISTGTAEVVALSNLTGYTPDIGDVVSFVFTDSQNAPHTVSYTVHAGDTLSTIETGLKAAFDALNSGVSLALSNGTLTFTGNAQGDAFTVAAPTVAQQAAGTSGAATSHTTANLAADTHQVVDVTLTGNVAGGATAEAGDTYSITLTPAHGDPVVISYVTVGDETAADILSILVAQIADSGIATATVSGNQLELTVSTAGVNYTVTSDVVVHAAGAANTAADVVTSQANVEARAAVAQVDTVELGALAYNAGDVVHVNVGSQHYDYTVATEMSATAVATAVAALVNANGGDASVTALASGTDITLTAKVAGVAFTSTATVDNVGLINNSVSQGHTTANVVAVAAVAQETDITVSGHVQLGNTYTLTVDPDGTGNHTVTVDYIAQSGDTLADVLSTLQSELVDTGVAVTGALVANQDGSEVLKLTASAAGTAFNASLTETAHAAGSNANSAAFVESQHNVVHADAVAQVSTLSLSGTFESGDTYTVTVDGDGNLATTADQVVATHTVAAGESLADVLGDLTSQINTATLHDGGVVAVLGSDTIQLTGNANGSSFLVTTATSNRAEGSSANLVELTGTAGHAAVAGQAQVDSLSLVNEHFVAGDTIDLLLNSTHFSYTVTGHEASNAVIAAALVAQVNNVNDSFTAVSAANNANAEVLVLTGTTTGIAFDASVNVSHHAVIPV